MFRVVELPQQQHICKVKSLNKGDANSEVTVYYQVRPHPEPAATSVCGFCVFIQSFSSSPHHLVWSQSFEGTYADGAAGGEC